MKITVDPHTHTFLCGHAYSTLLENLAAAKAAGMEGMGWTEHTEPMFLMKGSHMFGYMQVLDREVDGVRLLRGAELNICDATGDLRTDDSLLRHLDYAIASLHNVVWRDSGTKEECTSACITAMHHPMVRILGHPDFSFFPLDYDRLTDAARDLGVLLEVNNASLDPTSYRAAGARENLTEMLRLCEKKGVSVVVGSDAHFAPAVGRFPHALSLLDERQFPEELVANTSLAKFEAFLQNR